MKNVRFNIITLGCAKNICDSELLMGYLKKNSVETVHQQPIKKNDIIIVNTCGFINDAKQESIDYILELAESKKKDEFRELIVVGCLAQRYKNELKMEIPEIDVLYGLNYIPGILERYKLDLTKNLVGERVLTTPSHYAYLKISDGCNHLCSFCAIPLIKGKYHSVPVEQLILEVENLVTQGVKELIVIAQDTTWYGLDLYNKRRLAELLGHLSEVKGIEWIRLQYAYPAEFPLDVLDVIVRNPKLCKYIDLPVQHISDHMLSLMRRQINKEKTIRLIDEIRKKIPGIALRTSLIVGHPGETEDDFEELMEFVKNTRFERLGVFSYSHEENTKSFDFDDDVPKIIKEEEYSRIMTLQRQISFENNQNLVGSILKVMIDRMENEIYIGRTEFDTPEVDNEVLIDNKGEKLQPGEFYNVRITDAYEYDLQGELEG